MACSKCFGGSVHLDKSPTGTVTTVHSLPTYVAEPEGDAQGIVVIVADLFGWELSNTRVLADKYAAQTNCTVYLPDFLNGHAAPVSAMQAMESLLAPAPLLTTLLHKPILVMQVISAALPFFITNRPSVVEPRVTAFHQALRKDSSTGGLKIGSAGFCYGALYTVKLAQDNVQNETPWIDAAFIAHPSGTKVPDDFEKVTVPMSVAVGDIDVVMKAEKSRQVKSLLEGKGEGRYEVIIYPGAQHGFAIRANPSLTGQMESAAAAETQASAWFKEWLT